MYIVVVFRLVAKLAALNLEGNPQICGHSLRLSYENVFFTLVSTQGSILMFLSTQLVTRLFFCSRAVIKALLGMLARLSWGRRDMLGSTNGKHGGVSVKYVSLTVFCH